MRRLDQDELLDAGLADFAYPEGIQADPVPLPLEARLIVLVVGGVVTVAALAVGVLLR